MNEEEIKYILETLSFKTSIYRDKYKRNLSFNDDEYYSNVLYQYITQLQNNWNELKKWLPTRINTDKDYERNSHIKEKLQVEDYVIKQVMLFMQELEGNNDSKRDV